MLMLLELSSSCTFHATPESARLQDSHPRFAPKSCKRDPRVPNLAPSRARGHAIEVRKLLVIAAIASLPPTASAQQAGGQPLRAAADELARSVAGTFDCEISVLGEPRTYELSTGWYVAYSASGTQCDEAGRALNLAGEKHEFAFSRRPNLGQLRTLVSAMFYAAGSATGCQLRMVGKPSLNEATSQWLVRYRSAGVNCEEAGLELRRRGAELEISFMGGPDRLLPESFR
jgi:hypothetical protein